MKKNILITGAASGIGRATYEALNKDLYDNIVLTDINPIDADNIKKTSKLHFFYLLNYFYIFMFNTIK